MYGNNVIKEFSFLDGISKYTDLNAISDECNNINSNKARISGMLENVSIGGPIAGSETYCDDLSKIGDSINFDDKIIQEIVNAIENDIKQLENLENNINNKIKENQKKIEDNNQTINSLKQVPPTRGNGIIDPETGIEGTEPNEPEYTNAQNQIAALTSENKALENDNLVLINLIKSVKKMMRERRELIANLKGIINATGTAEDKLNGLFDEYDGVDHLDYIRDENGKVLGAVAYDSEGNYIGKAEVHYDRNGNVIQATRYDADYRVLRNKNYDEDGKIVASQRYTYNDDGQLIIKYDNEYTNNQLAKSTSYVYSEDGSIKRINESEFDGDLVKSQKSTEYEYDRKGNVKKEYTEFFENEKFAGTSKTTYGYGPGTKIGETTYYDIDGKKTGSSREYTIYDDNNNIKKNSTSYYDKNGKQTGAVTEGYTYNDEGKVSHITKCDYENDDEFPNKIISTDYEYDENGYMSSSSEEITSKDDMNKKEVTKTEYDENGNIISQTTETISGKYVFDPNTNSLQFVPDESSDTPYFMDKPHGIIDTPHFMNQPHEIIDTPHSCIVDQPTAIYIKQPIDNKITDTKK